VNWGAPERFCTLLVCWASAVTVWSTTQPGLRSIPGNHICFRCKTP